MSVVAETRYGRVEGEQRRGTCLFRGLPYARPPVGELRFAAPEPPEPWAGVRPAKRAGPAAKQPAPPLVRWLQPVLAWRGRSSEDCLSLNVWTPACDGARRPVMVWIHGGAFIFGTGSTPIYSGRRLARRGDVVVVTINYRLGALGYLHLSELLGREGPVASNCGLRDQVAALEWVRDNIEAFGGDPANVTIFGESAGAMSVGTLLGVPRARPLFHRAILQSGAAHHVSSSHKATGTAEFFLNELGLRPQDADRLRELPVDTLLGAQWRTMMRLGFADGALPWQPAVDEDLLPRQPLDSIAKGEAAGIPVLIGTNRDEFKLFIGGRKLRQIDEEELLRRVTRWLPGRDAEGVRHAERAITLYRRERLGRGRVKPWEILVALHTDRTFRYPAARLAELHAPHERTYAYLFDWLPPLLQERLGACHGLEIPFVFGTQRHPAVRPLVGGGSARELGRRMRQAWIAFAHTGDPSAEGLGVWQSYDPDRRRTMILGERCYPEERPLDAERAFWEGRLF